MKKKFILILSIITLLSFVFSFVACKTDATNNNDSKENKECVVRILSSNINLDLYDNEKIYLLTKNLTEEVVWSSSNIDVVTIDNDGVVCAVGAGYANITASANGITSSCLVSVVDNKISANIKLSSEFVSVSIDNDYTVCVDVFWKGVKVEDAKFDWMILDGQDTGIISCSIQNDGKDIIFTGLQEGQTKYVVSTTINNIYVAEIVTVNCVDTSIVFNISNMMIDDGCYRAYTSLINHGDDFTTLIPNISIYEENTKVHNPELVWDIEDDSIASIGLDGKIVALAEGTTTVTCSYKNSICLIILEVYRPSIVMDEELIISIEKGSVDFVQTLDGEITNVLLLEKNIYNYSDGETIYINNDNLPQNNQGRGKQKIYVNTTKVKYVYDAIVCDYSISNADELDQLQTVADKYAGTVGDGKMGGYIVLLNDIDYLSHKYGAYKVNGNYWKWSEHIDCGFQGVFDGRGYNIDNFTFEVAPSGEIGSGLFPGIVGGTICNVSFTNAIHNGYGFITNYINGGTIENTFVHIKEMVVRPSSWTNASAVFCIGGNTIAGGNIVNNIVVIDNYDSVENKYAYGIGLFNTRYMYINDTFVIGGSSTNLYDHESLTRSSKNYYASFNELTANLSYFAEDDFWICDEKIPIPKNLKNSIESLEITNSEYVSTDSIVELKATTTFVKYVLEQDAIDLGISIISNKLVIPKEVNGGFKFTVKAHLAYDSSVFSTKEFMVVSSTEEIIMDNTLNINLADLSAGIEEARSKVTRLANYKNDYVYNPYYTIDLSADRGSYSGTAISMTVNNSFVDSSAVSMSNGVISFPRNMFKMKGVTNNVCVTLACENSQTNTYSIIKVSFSALVADMVIENADDLDAMQYVAHKIANNDIDEWNFNFDGYFVLANNIIYNSTLDTSNGYNNTNNRMYKCYTQGWNAGYGAGGFSGTFDGRGFNIQGLVMSPSSSNQTYLQYYSGTGLFTCLKGKGSIKNVSFTHGVALGEGFLVGTVASNDGAFIENVAIQLDYMEGEKGQGTGWLTTNGAVQSWEGLGGNRWIDGVFVKIDSYSGNAFAFGRGDNMLGSFYCVADDEMNCYKASDSASTVKCEDYSRHYNTYEEFVSNNIKVAENCTTFWEYMDATYMN